MILGLYRQLCLPIFLKVYNSVFIHYDNFLTCVYTPIHADTAAGIIVGSPALAPSWFLRSSRAYTLIAVESFRCLEEARGIFVIRL
jgi:hypothetical protein